MRELAKGERIRFKSMNEFTGDPVELEGTVLGGSESVKKAWPIEMATAENCYLVKSEDSLGQDFHHAVFPEEILEIVAEKEEVL